MGLLDFPNPADWVESAKNGNMEREAINTVLSAVYSSWICGLWSAGKSKWLWFAGDMATSLYLSLSVLQQKNFLALTVPGDMLAPANLSKFQTIDKTK
jgi:hypothetical protein